MTNNNSGDDLGYGSGFGSVSGFGYGWGTGYCDGSGNGDGSGDGPGVYEVRKKTELNILKNIPEEDLPMFIDAWEFQETQNLFLKMVSEIKLI